VTFLGIVASKNGSPGEIGEKGPEFRDEKIVYVDSVASAAATSFGDSESAINKEIKLN